MTASIAVFLAAALSPVSSAELLPVATQNALVQKYCAVCHSNAARNGGLSLQHFDAARPDPPLAAMLLSKLRNGAMFAAGVPAPDPPTAEAWTAATLAQSERATQWHTIRTKLPEGNSITASVVTELPRRKAGGHPPLYRLILTCEPTRQGTIQLTWSPEPQTDRTFSVSVDGGSPVEHRLEGREKMGSGAKALTGLASAMLDVTLPEKSLAVRGLFPGEMARFLFDGLDSTVRRELSTCFAGVSP